MNELPNDRLDPLLREWHDANAARARELRDSVVSAARQHEGPSARRIGTWFLRGLAAAAAVAIAASLFLLVPFAGRDALASGIVMLPEGGRLDAVDRNGVLIGPCPLAHTDVDASIAGPFTRVTLVQRFRNPYQQPIEAIYVFPMSERAAVDSMRMTVRDASGERIVDGVVRERTAARQMYEAARAQGFVAGLLEQERPNVFTQSVANIAPGAEVDVRISYVETLAARDGTYEFAFPMTVGPRYVPGAPASGGGAADAPPGWVRAQRVVLLGPGRVALTPQDDAARAARLQEELGRAYAIDGRPHVAPPQDLATPELTFVVTYADGSQEPGELYPSGIGRLGGRMFAIPSGAPAPGTGFSQGTDAVPDAARITPMPTRPDTRAGHDISIRVALDTGGIPVRESTCVQHGVDMKWDGPSRADIALRGGSTIPNRDFVLRWSLKDDAILEGAYSHVAPPDPVDAAMPRTAPSPQVDGYLTLVLNPPVRVAPAAAVPRELVFVVDTSGSMSGFPIEKSKELLRRALASMRPCDAFNVVTFAGETHVLWEKLRPATKENVAEATALVEGTRSGGGTEMMKAIEAALVRMPKGPAAPKPDGSVSVPPNTPVRPGDRPDADGRPGTAQPEPMRIAVFLTDGFVGNDQSIVAAIRANAGSTRVFSLGIGSSVNRWLIESMAQAGRGASEVVLLGDDADAAVQRLAKRIETPVLADIRVAAEGIELSEIVSGSTDVSGTGLVPDLFDARPLVLHARYARGGSGTVVLRGRTGDGPWERRIPVSLGAAPAAGPAAHAMLPQLWARSRVDVVLADHLQEVEQQTLPRDVRAQVVRLGERYSIVTPYTSFVAIERSKVVSNGRPMLVSVPVELPEGTRFEGFFGDCWANGAVEFAVQKAGGVRPEAANGAELKDAGGEMEAGKRAAMQRGKPGGPATAGAPASGAPFVALDAARTDTKARRDARSAAAPQVALRGGGYGNAVPGNPGGGGGGSGGLGGGLVTAVGAPAVNSPPPAPLASSAPPAPAAPAEVAAGRAESGKERAEKAQVSAVGADAADAAVFAGADLSRGKASGGVPGRPMQDGSVIYRVQRGDTLSGIAERAYGKSDAWKRVLAANERLLKGNERAIREGMELVLPGPVQLEREAVQPGVLPPETLDRLARVLDRRLLAIALYQRLSAEEKAKLPPLERELARLVFRGTVPVLVRATGRRALASMESTGVAVQWCEMPAGSPEGVLAIVSIPPERLQELALTDGVLAVSPFEAVGAAAAASPG